MKRSTAVRHVIELAEEADRLVRLPGGLNLPLSELWVGGELLEEADHIEWALVVIKLDISTDEFPHLALHSAIPACESFLRLDKRPIDVRWRSRQAPAWDHEVRRVARAWSETSGTDERLLHHLRNGTVGDERIQAPTLAQLRTFLTDGLPRAERHLAEVLDGYWEPGWRRAHRGNGVHAEHHLWRAAEAVRSMREALDGLDYPESPRPDAP